MVLATDEFIEFGLGEHGDAEFLSFVQFAAGFVAGDEVVGGFRDAAGGAAAVAGDQRLDFVAGVFFERAGDDQRFAGQRAWGVRGWGLRRRISS